MNTVIGRKLLNNNENFKFFDGDISPKKVYKSNSISSHLEVQRKIANLSRLVELVRCTMEPIIIELGEPDIVDGEAV